MRALPVLAVALLLAAVPAAHAATVTYSTATGLAFTAAPGERNAVTLLTDPSSAGIFYVVRDAVTLTPGAGCVQGAAPTEVRCVTGATSGGNLVVTADLGDLDDTWDGGGITTESGDQFITAGTGSDTVTTTSKFDNLDLGPGNDTAETKGGDDKVLGGDGKDTIFGGGGDDDLQGGASSDTVDYSRGAGRLLLARLNGAVEKPTGTDTTSGFEVIIGTALNDRIIGTTGLERIEGRAGADSLYGDPQAFQLFDPAGATASAAACCFTTATTVKTGSTGGTPSTQVATVTTVPNVPTSLLGQVRLGDVLLGGTENDRLIGSDRDDDLNGEAGEDFIRAREGADKIFAREGQRDDIECGAGFDTMTIDLRDVFEAAVCEQVDQGALKEGRHVRFGPSQPTIKAGYLQMIATCPKQVTIGCRGTLQAVDGAARGMKEGYRMIPGGVQGFALRVPKGTGTFRLISVEKGRFGAKTTIRTLRR